MTPSRHAIPARKLRVFLVEEDKGHHESLYLTILHLLHDAGIGGGTVFRGIAGFGERRIVHTNRLEISGLDLPIVIEAVDTPEKFDAIVPRIAELLSSGLLELSHTTILRSVPNLVTDGTSEGGH